MHPQYGNDQGAPHGGGGGGGQGQYAPVDQHDNARGHGGDPEAGHRGGGGGGMMGFFNRGGGQDKNQDAGNYGQAGGAYGGGGGGGYSGPPTGTNPQTAYGGPPTGTNPQTAHGGYGQPGVNPGASLNRNMHQSSQMSLGLFGAALCVVVGALISAIVLLFDFQLIDFLEMIFLFLFGSVLAIIDTPYFRTLMLVNTMSVWIQKYIALLTRLTGKGLCYLFLGTALFSSMWTNEQGGFMRILAIIFCLYVFLAGVFCISLGIMLSLRLEKTRDQLVKTRILDNRYAEFAKAYPPGRGHQQTGLTHPEFGLLINEVGLKFDDVNLKLVCNALVSNPSWRMNMNDEPKIPLEDLKAWLNGGWVML